MKAKKWTFLFVAIMAVCLIAVAALNYFVDPYGYFRAQGGDCNDLNEDYYLREIKAEHIRTHGDEYEAFLIGGSKAGAVRVESLQKMDGYTYYNDWVLSGTFEDYYYNTKYILKMAKPKKIVWQLSTTELRNLNRAEKGPNFEIPAQVQGKSKKLEMLSFLLKNPSLSIDELNKDKTKIYACLPGGERDIDRYYALHEQYKDNYYGKFIAADVADNIKKLDEGARKRTQIINESIEWVRRAKASCDEAGVKFQLYIAPTFVGEQLDFEGEGYYNFLKRLLGIVDEAWCFNDINEYTCNPNNFYNATHFYYEVGDAVVETMKNNGQIYKGFGTKLTLDNLATYIQGRKESYKKLQEYYHANKTLPLGKYQDGSNLVR